jgi:cell division protein FtsQ
VTVERLRANRRRPRRARSRVGMPLLAGALLAAGAIGGLVGSRTASLAALRLPSLSGWLRGAPFSVRHVDVIGLHALRAEDVVAELGLRPGTPLLDVDPEAIAAKLAPNPRIAGVRALRIPPDRLLVAVEERAPIGVLADSGRGFDAEGRRFALAPGEGDGLPRVAGDPVAAAGLLAAARERGVEIASVEASAAGDVRFRPAGSEALVRVGADADAGLDGWLRVAASGLERAHGAREVDLRFRGSAVLRARDSQASKGGERNEP